MIRNQVKLSLCKETTGEQIVQKETGQLSTQMLTQNGFSKLPIRLKNKV